MEAVRKRPGMYIGSTGSKGLHHLVFEIVDNSIDEFVVGQCDTINVIIHQDNSVTVSDNGRGIPVDMHPMANRPAIEVIMTTLHSGGKFGGSGYTISGGLHGVGLSVVSALSSQLQITVKRDGHIYRQDYERGKPATELQMQGDTNETGTAIRFFPDPEIFEELIFDREIIIQRLRELAFLNKGLLIKLADEREEELYQSTYESNGLMDFVAYINQNKDTVNQPPIYFNDKKDDVIIEVAIQYNSGYSE
ncbi:MAG: DNA topoisomerase IV subunit B, partial [Syntrophomonadaceae bacterium]|nr:DNA topoisomerase IV subunit B [Syntrophomonadaceae bacterium]